MLCIDEMSLGLAPIVVGDLIEVVRRIHHVTPSRRNVSWSVSAAVSRGMWIRTTARELIRVMAQRKYPYEKLRAYLSQASSHPGALIP